MNNYLKISQQTLWQILGKATTAISTIIILGIVARNYGEAGTGIFTLALTYLAIFYLLADFGFNAHVLRKFTIYPSASLKAGNLQFTIEWKKLLGTRIIWSGILVVLAVAALPFLPFVTAEFSKAILFGSLGIAGSSIFVTCNLIFQSKLRYDLSVLAVSLGTVISLGLFVFLSLQKYPVSYLLLAHLAGSIIIAAVSFILTQIFLPKLLPVFDFLYVKQLFRDSWPIAATLALNVVYFRIDSFMIAYFKGISDVGIYNIAYSVFQSALVIPAFIMNSYYPLMLKSLKAAKFIGLGLLALACFGTVLTIVFTPFIISILTGSGFAGSVKSLQILSLGFPAYFLSSLLMWVMIAKGRYKLMLAIYACGLLFNITTNFIYIPQYSFLAASWITVISEYLLLLMQIFYLRGIIFR